MDKWLYVLINLGAVSVPFIAGFDRRLRFNRQWRYLFPALILTMVIFIPWDMLKTHLGVWGFNSHYITGIYIGNLPAEEWLFFIAIPYACIFTYHALNIFIRKDYLGKSALHISRYIAVVLIVTGFLNHERLYTSVTFLATGGFLLFHSFVIKADYMGRFFMMYFVTLIPFFIVNGILTGSFIPGEVVYYDNTQNLGIRIGTIPLEDMVYSMLMLLMNVTWFEWLKKWKIPNPVNPP
jgi:lycopene cyclase domain-containing protein